MLQLLQIRKSVILSCINLGIKDIMSTQLSEILFGHFFLFLLRLHLKFSFTSKS